MGGSSARPPIQLDGERLERILDIADPVEREALLEEYARELLPRRMARRMLARIYTPDVSSGETAVSDWAAQMRTRSDEDRAKWREAYAQLAGDPELAAVEREVGRTGLEALRQLDTPFAIDAINDFAAAVGRARYERTTT